MAESNNNIGAVSALKGFRVQFLYSLNRILSHTSEEASFHPEGRFEDLDIYNSGGSVIEIVQVKNLGRKLTLSDILSNDVNSFLRRAVKVHSIGCTPRIKLISFGEVNDDIKELAGSNVSGTLKSKLKKLDLKDEQIDILQKHFMYEVVNESIVTSQITERLNALKIYIDNLVSLDLMIYWLYCAAEKQRVIESKSIQEQLLAIGRFQGDRVSFYNTYGTLIRPLSKEFDSDDSLKLKSDFYQGISTRFSHILAGVDVLRVDKLLLLNEKFKWSNVVFIHGASGQGKSTLAFRYLHDYCDDNTTFQLLLPSNIQSVFEIINSLESISRGINFPITIYIDVVPGNLEWITILQDLATKGLFRFIVTIREEDWNSVNIGDKFSFSEIELSLDESEASLIYDSLNEFNTDLRFTDFKNAWDIFGGSGPLLEFVYLITQGESLPDKLKSQINFIQDDYSDLAKDKIKLLRYVCLADCFNAKVLYRDVAQHLKLDNIKRLIELLEKEYLLKLTEGDSCITGLHPVRSEILRDLLFDGEIHEESQYVLESLDFIAHNTVLAFLRNAFRYSDLDPNELLNRLQSLTISSWVFYHSIFKSLLWKGVADYVEQNIELLNEVNSLYGQSWIVIVDVDIAGVTEGGNLMENFDLFSPEHQAYAKQVNARLTDRNNIFQYCRDWVNLIGEIKIDPSGEDELHAFGLFMFWLNHLKIQGKVSSISEKTIQAGFNIYSLPVLAQTLYALKNSGDVLKMHVGKAETIFLERLYSAHDIISINESAHEISCDYFLNLLNNYEGVSESNMMHEKSMRIINLLRLAYADKVMFCTQAHGHRFSFLPSASDESFKRVPRQDLPLTPLVEINSTFINLVNFRNRLKNWVEYVDIVMERRALYVDILEKSLIAYGEYHKKKDFSALQNFVRDYDKVYKLQLQGKTIPLFPKSIMDEWGITGEGGDLPRQNMQSTKVNLEQKRALSFRRYQEYDKLCQEYDNSVNNYLWQSAVVIAVRIRELANEDVSGSADYSRSSLVGNLFKAFEILEDFQRAFRSHFGKFVEPNALDEIERQETMCISALCFVYRHFIHSKTFLSGNILKSSLGHMGETNTSFLKRFITDFKTLGKKIKMHFHVEFDEPAKCIVILSNSNSSFDTINNLEAIYQQLYTTINQPDPTSVKWAILTKRYQSVFIVPLVYSKSVQGKWYEFKMYHLVSSQYNELGIHNLIPRDMPEETRSKYGIDLWGKYIADLSKLDRILTCSSTCYQLAFHFQQFHKFEQVTLAENGERNLDAYLSAVAAKLHENLQEAVDLYSYYIDKCNDGIYHFDTDEEKQQLFQLLIANHMNFYPSDQFYEKRDTENEISTKLMEEWIPRLEELTNNMILIYLILADKILFNSRADNTVDSEV